MAADAPAVGVIGIGWVGLVTAACFADLGHDVVAVDIDEQKVARLRDGEVPIHEPGLAELVSRNAERLTFTTEMDDVLERSKLLFCCVDTPPTYSGDADLSRVRAVVDHLPEGEHVLVMKSTVPAGTGTTIRRQRQGLSYVSCPEFLKEGSAVEDFIHPDRVVIGTDPGDEAAADAVAELYEPLGGEIVRTDVASAEMVKLASNAFLATKISFINEIANVCEEVGADVTEVAQGMGLDQRIGHHFLRAGVGYGGSCFAPDETLLVRYRGTCKVVSFEELWQLGGGDQAAVDGEAIEADRIEAWSWVPGEAQPEWMPVSVLTKRQHEGEIVEVRTELGYRIRVTADHPFIVGDGEDDEVLTRVLARDLSDHDWLPFVADDLVHRWTAVRPSVPSVQSSTNAVLGWPGMAKQAPSGGVATSRTERTAAEAARTGYRRFGEGPGWVRVLGCRTRDYRGAVYSLKVPGSQTVVVSGGLIASQCFPKDTQALKQLAGNTGYHFQLLTAVIEVNELQKRRVVGKLEKHLGSLEGRTVALLGLAFKPNTDDMREASSLVLAARLQGAGAEVVAHDPVAQGRAGELLPSVEMRDSVEDAVAGADAVVLVTEWPQFAALDWSDLAARMAKPLLVDGRNFLDPETIRAAGFIYEGIGRRRPDGGQPAGGGSEPADVADTPV